MELTGIGQVLRGLGDLYILIALAAFAISLYKPIGWKKKAISMSIIAIVFGFIPAKNWIEKRQEEAFAREAWAYFKKLCAEKSGEKIYKTYSGVKSVQVIKPLPAATDKDHYDQFWYGDPYSASATSVRTMTAATSLTLDSRGPNGIKKGLEFVELRANSDDLNQYLRISRPQSNDKKASIEKIEKPVSRLGISWEDISTPGDRKFWVAASRLRILDLVDNSVVAERYGFFIESGFGSQAGQRRPWLTSRGPDTTCPSLVMGDYTDTWFVSKVFKEGEEK